MDTAKKKLKVNISEIADAMQSTFDGDLHYYLDSETGKVILIQDEVISAVEGNDRERIVDPVAAESSGFDENIRTHGDPVPSRPRQEVVRSLKLVISNA